MGLATQTKMDRGNSCDRYVERYDAYEATLNYRISEAKLLVK